MYRRSNDKCVFSGDRIECNGHFGTIEYIGLITGYDGTWLGVDWDDPTRGKHSGTHNGVQYFVASYSTSGSFVRIEKVHTGQSVVDAIESRYGKSNEDTSLTERQLHHITQSINAPFLELVGFEKIANKQSDFNNLQVINVRLQNVSYAWNTPNELRQLCPNVTEIDISKNLFVEWRQVFVVCEQLEHLEWLNVSENLLRPLNDNDCANVSFQGLRTLICGSMRLDWPTVELLSGTFPNLEELRVPHNRIITFDTSSGVLLANLKLLDLEGNPILDWNNNELVRLDRAFPNLQHVNLENVGLRQIQLEEGMFKSLNKLVISDNLIQDWQSIGELNKLDGLENLRLLKNPVLETENNATCTQLIVARIGNLKVLNGATIKDEERRGAEYDYIKKYAIGWLLVRTDAGKLSEFLTRHNRYDKLIEKYGVPEESELVAQPKLIGDSLVRVAFEHAGCTIVKRLPPSMHVQKMVALAQRIFRLDLRPTLVYVSGRDADIEIELSDESKELAFYSVQDGDRIAVVC